jgi:hypothetical protein
MPGNVPAVSGSLPVMPHSLFKAFTQSREFAVMASEYPDGSSQRRVQISNGGDREDILPRMSWDLSKRLTPTKMVELYEFFQEVGNSGPFYFYDPYGGVGIGNHDPSGADADGRYVGVFIGGWKQDQGVGRGEVQLKIVELALAAGSDTLDFSDEDASGLLMVI